MASRIGCLTLLVIVKRKYKETRTISQVAIATVGR